MSSKTPTKPSTVIDTRSESSSDILESEEPVQISQEPLSGETQSNTSDIVALVCAPSTSPDDGSSAVTDPPTAVITDCAADQRTGCGPERQAIDAEGASDADDVEGDANSVSEAGSTDACEVPLTVTTEAASTNFVDQAGTAPTPDSQELPNPSCLPDADGISVRLRNLVVAVGQVEELSRRAREAAASDLELYNGIASSHRQFEDGLADARRIGQEAADVYKRAFGREAKAVAEPAVTEAREIEQAFAELSDAWRQRAESFLCEHPDVESLLAEQREHEEDVRRRHIARTKAERFQQLVNAADGALRQGLLDDARDCLKMLGAEFPNEADRFKPLHDRLQHRIRAANDAAARRALVEASELQGRGEFNAAVRLLEAVDVLGLSREASEDVFGRWSAACSLLAQTGDLELLRYSPAQGRGIILHHDPSVPYGLVEFSALGMGPSHFEGRVVSAGDREGALIISRARPFRAAELPTQLNAGWSGRSYVIPSGFSTAPVRH